MKKILVLIMVVFAVATSSFAIKPVQYEIFYKLNNESNFNSMARYLNANEDQKDQLKYVFLKTEEKMKYALKKEDLMAAEKVLYFNLGNIKSILTEDQYKKYLMVVNVSINNIDNNDEMIANNNIK